MPPTHAASRRDRNMPGPYHPHPHAPRLHTGIGPLEVLRVALMQGGLDDLRNDLARALRRNDIDPSVLASLLYGLQGIGIDLEDAKQALLVSDCGNTVESPSAVTCTPTRRDTRSTRRQRIAVQASRAAHANPVRRRAGPGTGAPSRKFEDGTPQTQTQVQPQTAMGADGVEVQEAASSGARGYATGSVSVPCNATSAANPFPLAFPSSSLEPTYSSNRPPIPLPLSSPKIAPPTATAITGLEIENERNSERPVPVPANPTILNHPKTSSRKRHAFAGAGKKWETLR